MAKNHKLDPLKKSAIAISSVVLVEVILGFAVNSLAILSDGVHALLDTLTTIALFIATRASLKPPDEEHMYGHEKFESIGGLAGGLALIGVALLIMYEAVLKIIENKTINTGLELVGFAAIGYTFCVDFYRVSSFRQASHSESSTMRAGFYHAVADLSSTIIALLGFGLAVLGINYGDSLASMVLGILLTYLSVRLVWNSSMELSDTISKDVAEKVKRQLLDTKDILKFENLKIRKAGDKIFIRATVQVPDYLSLEEAHDLASNVEDKIRKTLGNAEVSLHTEPQATEMPTEKLVEKLAMEVEGVKEAHEINVSHTEGKLYITLHAYVSSRLSIEKAHEMAEKIENRIEQGIKGVENVTVHTEPLSARKRKGSLVHENEIRRIINETASAAKAYRIEKIVTYVAGKERYINIDCCFTKETSVEEAHRIASEMEDKVKAHFAETIVTVHMETE